MLVAIGISSLVRVVRPKQIAEQNPRPATHVTTLLIWLTILGIIVTAVPVLANSHRARTALMLLAAVTLITLEVRTLIAVEYHRCAGDTGLEWSDYGPTRLGMARTSPLQDGLISLTVGGIGEHKSRFA